MLSTVLCLATLGQPFLPGKDLSVGRAKAEAQYIVAAEVGRTGDLLSFGEYSLLMWTELKPSSMLKGEIDRDELNRRPLRVRALRAKGERLPKSGDVGIFFIGDANQNSPIIKVLPDMPENREAIRVAEPERIAGPPKGNFGGGLDGGGLGGGGSPLVAGVKEPAPKYRTYVVPAFWSSGEAHRVQESFTAEFSAHDPKPEERQAHFAWVFKNETARRYGASQVGWHGCVSGFEPRPGGGWLVTLTLRPDLRTNRLRFALISDEVRETYAFVDGAILPISSDATTPRPDLQRFPLAY